MIKNIPVLNLGGMSEVQSAQSSSISGAAGDFLMACGVAPPKGTAAIALDSAAAAEGIPKAIDAAIESNGGKPLDAVVFSNQGAQLTKLDQVVQWLAKEGKVEPDAEIRIKGSPHSESALQAAADAAPGVKVIADNGDGKSTVYESGKEPQVRDGRVNDYGVGTRSCGGSSSRISTSDAAEAPLVGTGSAVASLIGSALGGNSAGSDKFDWNSLF
jgi:hypothetical protein